jgi:hypothetical protein
MSYPKPELSAQKHWRFGVWEKRERGRQGDLCERSNLPILCGVSSGIVVLLIFSCCLSLAQAFRRGRHKCIWWGCDEFDQIRAVEKWLVEDNTLYFWTDGLSSTARQFYFFIAPTWFPIHGSSWPRESCSFAAVICGGISISRLARQ